MPIPSRLEAAALLAELRLPPRLVRHSTAVAEVASFLARRIAARGTDVDRRLVEVAALLHDIDKGFAPDHPAAHLGHGHAGAQWLIERGLAELAPAVRHHPVTRLVDDEHYATWSRDASLEERVVAYADKRAAQRLQSMDARFARWEKRHPESRERLARARQRADELEREVCAAAGVAPGDVGREAWVARASEGARARAPGGRQAQPGRSPSGSSRDGSAP